MPTHEPTGDPYTDLPWEGSIDLGVGHALITMVEPHPGHEHEYNRWFEGNHYFDGAMYMPWMYSGRRWVATHELQQLRYPADSPVASPVTAGAYITTYWITPGRAEDHKRWAFATNDRLVSVGNVNRDRTHVFTSFHDHAGTVYASDDVPLDRFTLIDPSPGLVVEIVDAPTVEGRDALERWLLDEHLPARVTPDGPVASAMVFQVTPPSPRHKPEIFASLQKVANEGRRLTILWFLRADPRECWDRFTGEVEALAAGGLGVASFVAPFIPCRMGTHRYEDEIRPPGVIPRTTPERLVPLRPGEPGASSSA